MKSFLNKIAEKEPPIAAKNQKNVTKVVIALVSIVKDRMGERIMPLKHERSECGLGNVKPKYKPTMLRMEERMTPTQNLKSGIEEGRKTPKPNNKGR